MKNIMLILLIIGWGSTHPASADDVMYRVEASSTLKNKHNRYDASNLNRYDPSFAWCTAKFGKEDTWLDVFLEEPLTSGKAYKVSILPGYAKSDELFLANSRIKAARLMGEDSKGNKVFSIEVKFQDSPNLQSALLSENSFSQKALKLKILVTEVYLGQKYEDLCVAELKVSSINKGALSYEKQSQIEEKEIATLKDSINSIEAGNIVEIVNLFRLANSLYYKTAEGSEWINELYLDYFVKIPREFLFLLSRQEDGVKYKVEKVLLSPISDKYDDVIIANALSKALSDGVPKGAYPNLEEKYSSARVRTINP